MRCIVMQLDLSWRYQDRATQHCDFVDSLVPFMLSLNLITMNMNKYPD